MEAELNRWQLAYETISTLITSMANSETNASWIPILLHYPIDANEMYLPLLENHDTVDNHVIRAPTHASVGGISVRNSPDCASVLTQSSFGMRMDAVRSTNGDLYNDRSHGSKRTQEVSSHSTCSPDRARWLPNHCPSRQNLPRNRLNVRGRPNLQETHVSSFRLNDSACQSRNIAGGSSSHRRNPSVFSFSRSPEPEVNFTSRNGALQTGFNSYESQQPRMFSSPSHGVNPPISQTIDSTNTQDRMSNSGDVCDLFHRLLKNFYTETLLWMFVNTILHPGSRRILNRIRFLAAETGRSLQQATYDMLTGFLNGYQHSRERLVAEIGRSLRGIDVESFRQRGPGEGAVNLERAVRLRQLALELGAVLNPRQMLRSFGSVVREVTLQTISSPGRHREYVLQQFHDWNYPIVVDQHSFQLVNHLYSQRSSPSHRLPTNLVHPWQLIPPPPPPYPGFLLHFLALLDEPAAPPEIPDYYDDLETYEALSDRLGVVIPSGLMDDDIQKLPVYLYKVTPTDQEPVSDQESCVICLGLFIKGQCLRLLPCGHSYHCVCVDRWLKIKNTCPVCRNQLEHSTYL